MPLALQVIPLWLQSGIWSAFIAAVVLTWLIFHQDPHVPFSEAPPQLTDLSIYWSLWLFCPRCRILHFLSFNFMLFLTSQPYSLSKSPYEMHILQILHKRSTISFSILDTICSGFFLESIIFFHHLKINGNIVWGFISFIQEWQMINYCCRVNLCTSSGH